jgi:hypothetical protein
MADCYKCGRIAGFMFNECEACSQLAQDEADGIRHTAEGPIAGPIIDADREPVVVRCPVCSEKILSTAKKCRHCGEWLNSATNRGAAVTSMQTAAPASPQRTTRPLSVFGTVLMLGGCAGMLYGFKTKTSVPLDVVLFPGQEVTNVGLLNDRDNTIRISGVVSIIGVVLLVAGAQRKPRRMD